MEFVIFLLIVSNLYICYDEHFSIDLKINEGKIKIDKHIGENVGYQTKSGWKMIDREGVICTS